MYLFFKSITCKQRLFKKYIVFLITFCWIFVDSTQVIAQKPVLKFNHIQEGLNSKQVSRVHQDSFGYIWVATSSGLHRYDGINFEVYLASEDSNRLTSNDVTAVYEDKHENLWIGTQRGICKYNRASDDFTRFKTRHTDSENNASINIIFQILEDENGKLWITSERDGLLYFNRQKQTFIPYGPLSSNLARAMCKGGKDILWVGTTDSGLNKVNTATEEVTYFRHDPEDPHSISSNHISCLEMGPNGNLWVGTNTQGLNKLSLDEPNGHFHHYTHDNSDPNSLGNNDIYTIYVDKHENVWIGNENGGLHLYNKQSDSFYRYNDDPTDPTSLSHNSIWCIYEDHQGRFWVGTSVAGLNVIDKYDTKFFHYRSSPLLQNDLSNNIVRDFTEDKTGNIWIATDGGGVNYFNRENDTFTSFQHDPSDPQSIGSDAIIALTTDREDNLWVGTWSGGISIVKSEDRNKFVSFNEMYSNTTINIRSVFGITQDKKDGYIWIASYDAGIYQYDINNRSLRAFKHNPDDSTSITNNFTRRIFEDSQHNIWVATLDGLSLLTAENKKKGIFKQFFHDDSDSSSIPNNEIHQIAEDHNQNIWLATSYGLSKYDRKQKRFYNYYQKDGLPTNEIRSLVVDDNGNLWIGTTNGISKLNPETSVFKNYDTSDGLQGSEFSEYSATKLSTGELIFGGMNGFNIFHPDSIKDNPYIPPVHLTDFKIFNKSIDINKKGSPLNKHIAVAKEVVLTYDQSVFTFDFIALNYTNAKQNQYAYMMKGFEDKWNYVGTQRNATYTSLEPGEYTFKVKASNNDGLWNEQGTSIKVIILPPWWQTWWFKAISILFIISVTITAYKLRVQSIQKQKTELQRLVNEKTTELKGKNRELLAQSKMLGQKNKELDQFAYIVSHDLKAPLRGINSLSEWIEEDIEEGNEVEVKDNIKTLRGRVRRMRSLIDGILQYSRVGRIKTDVKNVKTFPLVKEAIDMLEIPDHFTVHISDELPTVSTNDTLISQVFSNLISNAIKYHDKPQGNIYIDCKEHDESYEFSVSDDGPGIPDEYKTKVFGMFQTLQARDTVESTGVGLAIVKKIIEEQGGEIWAESTPEEGARFCFTIPKDKNAPSYNDSVVHKEPSI